MFTKLDHSKIRIIAKWVQHNVHAWISPKQKEIGDKFAMEKIHHIKNVMTNLTNDYYYHLMEINNESFNSMLKSNIEYNSRLYPQDDFDEVIILMREIESICEEINKKSHANKY